MMNSTIPSAPANKLRSPLIGVIGGIVLVAAVLGVLVYFDIHERVVELLEWFKAQGAWASVAFILVMALVVVLLLPGALLTMGAGFVYGVVEGTCYVVVGTTLGATLAFLIARYLFGDWASKYVKSNAQLQLFSDEFTRNDWKIVLLTRLIPFFPSKLANYFFGLTRFRLPGYIGASFVGYIPFSLHNVYLGSLVADLSQLGAGELERSPLQWAIYAAGFIATVIAIFYFNRMARRTLALYRDEDSREEDNREEDNTDGPVSKGDAK